MTTKQLIAELRSVLATGFWEWDVRGPSHLPPGAWLRRTGTTCTPLDTFDPTYIHPLLALSVYRGRFDADSPRESHAKLLGAQLTFDGALTYWSQALGVTRAVAAKWFYVFTPPLSAPPREMIHVARMLDEKRGEVFAALDIHVPLNAMLSQPGDWPAACVRPDFWTKEVR